MSHVPTEALVIFVFIFTLALLHLVWVFWRPQSPMFWHAVDYVWLSVALIAVVPQLLEIRRVMAGYDQTISGVDAYFSLHRLRVAAIQPCARGTDADQLAVCRWKGAVRERFTDDLPESPRNFGGRALPPAPPVRDTAALAEVRRITEAHQEYMLEVGKWRAAFWRAQPSDLSRIVLVLSPFLLVTAVALRATKVSAQIRAGLMRGGAAAAAAPQPDRSDPNTPPVESGDQPPCTTTDVGHAPEHAKTESV